MALQITNPKVVDEVERLARVTGLTKMAVVERAVDRLAEEIGTSTGTDRFAALLAQLDCIPDRADAFDPLGWDTPRFPK